MPVRASSAEVFAATRERGVLTRPLSAGLAMSPPLTIEPGEIEQMASAIGEALDAVVSARGAAQLTPRHVGRHTGPPRK